MDENYLEKNKYRKERRVKIESLKNKWAKVEKLNRMRYRNHKYDFVNPDLRYIGISTSTPCRYSSAKFYTKRDKRKIFTYRIYEDFELIYPLFINNCCFNNSNYKKHMIRY